MNKNKGQEMKEVKMFKNGKWVRWDGSDVKNLILEERITLEELKKHYPKRWRLIRRLRTT